MCTARWNSFWLVTMRLIMRFWYTVPTVAEPQTHVSDWCKVASADATAVGRTLKHVRPCGNRVQDQLQRELGIHGHAINNGSIVQVNSHHRAGTMGFYGRGTSVAIPHDHLHECRATSSKVSRFHNPHHFRVHLQSENALH